MIVCCNLSLRCAFNNLIFYSVKKTLQRRPDIDQNNIVVYIETRRLENMLPNIERVLLHEDERGVDERRINKTAHINFEIRKKRDPDNNDNEQFKKTSPIIFHLNSIAKEKPTTSTKSGRREGQESLRYSRNAYPSKKLPRVRRNLVESRKKDGKTHESPYKKQGGCEMPPLGRLSGINECLTNTTVHHNTPIK